VQADADLANAASWNIRSEVAGSALAGVAGRRDAVCAGEANEDSAGAESAAAV